jgi:hypothetical protein
VTRKDTQDKKNRQKAEEGSGQKRRALMRSALKRTEVISEEEKCKEN